MLQEVDVVKRLNETKLVIEQLRSQGLSVPEEAFEMQQIMQRCVNAESMLATDVESKLSLGREAYESYARSTGWKSLVTGDRLLSWEEMSDEVQAAWMCSAAWVAGRTIRKFGIGT